LNTLNYADVSIGICGVYICNFGIKIDKIQKFYALQQGKTAYNAGWDIKVLEKQDF
jgi:hypothetical protein